MNTLWDDEPDIPIGAARLYPHVADDEAGTDLPIEPGLMGFNQMVVERNISPMSPGSRKARRDSSVMRIPSRSQRQGAAERDAPSRPPGDPSGTRAVRGSKQRLLEGRNRARSRDPSSRGRDPEAQLFERHAEDAIGSIPSRHNAGRTPADGFARTGNGAWGNSSRDERRPSRRDP